MGMNILEEEMKVAGHLFPLAQESDEHKVNK